MQSSWQPLRCMRFTAKTTASRLRIQTARICFLERCGKRLISYLTNTCAERNADSAGLDTKKELKHTPTRRGLRSWRGGWEMLRGCGRNLGDAAFWGGVCRVGEGVVL